MFFGESCHTFRWGSAPRLFNLAPHNSIGCAKLARWDMYTRCIRGGQALDAYRVRARSLNPPWYFSLASLQYKAVQSTRTIQTKIEF